MDPRGVQIARWHALLLDRIHGMSNQFLLASYNRKYDDPELVAWQTAVLDAALPEFAAAIAAVLPLLQTVDANITEPRPRLKAEERPFRNGETTIIIADVVTHRSSLVANYVEEASPWKLPSSRDWIAGLDEERLMHVTAHEALRCATWLQGVIELESFLQQYSNAAARFRGAVSSTVYNITHESSDQWVVLERWGVTFNNQKDLRKQPLLDAVATILEPTAK
jgi:hypothetical protein